MSSRTSSIAELVLLAAAFALAHTQSPLFFSNQNQYLLHGLAAGGLGELSSDWLASTTDPTPLFSLGVAAAFRWLGLWPLQVAYFLLLMAYFLTIWWLILGLAKSPPTRGQRFTFAAIFVAIHATLFRWGSVLLFGVDYPWYLQAGVAGQYVLGPGLQPSAFGVLLIAALAAFVHRRPFLSIALQSLACLIHSTYLLPAGLLTAGYLVAMLLEGNRRMALIIGGAAILGIVPTVVLTLASFSPSDAHTFAESQRVLAFVRIPHHTRVDRWLDGIAGLQAAWIGLGILLTRGTRLFPVLAVASLIALVLTLAQWLSGDATFALFFPWRISALLMPIATAVLAWRFVARLPESTFLRWGIFAPLCLVSVLGGLAIVAQGIGYASNEAEVELLTMVRISATPGDVYLLPSRYPAVGTGSRGSISASFTPPPRPKPGSNLIPVDLQRFRLLTGAPIFVDFKSVPYRDTEVLEWKRRMDLTQTWYDSGWQGENTATELKREGITHVIVPRGKPASAAWLEPVHEDAAYIVYRVR